MYGTNIENSFYYATVSAKPCLGKYKTFEDLVYKDSVFKAALESKTKINIYADDESYIKFYTALLKTHITNLDEKLFLECCKIESVRLKTRAKIIDSEPVAKAINELADKFYNLQQTPQKVYKFILTPQWVMDNAGVEWKIMNGKLGNVKDLIDRYVYSHFDEARVKYLSRKEPAGWVTDVNNYSYETVTDMYALYKEMRKEVSLFTDNLLIRYYETGDIQQIVNNPLFLILISANKNMPDKINIWLTRYIMKVIRTQNRNLGILS